MIEGVRENEHRKIAIDKIIPNEWNVNKMDDVEFARLIQEIKELGFITPIDVVPLSGEDDKYEILGGHHRYEACKSLGYTEIDCTVITNEKFKDEDLRKFVSIRLNVIKGKIDSEKFVTLYEEMASKYGAESLQDLMGFCDKHEWNKITSGVRDALKGSGVPKGAISKFDDAMKEMKTVDGLSAILNKIFNEHGDTVGHNFISFSFGSKDGIFIMCEDEELFNSVKGLLEEAKDKNVKADTAIGKFVKNWKESGIDDIEPNVDVDINSEGANY